MRGFFNSQGGVEHKDMVAEGQSLARDEGKGRGDSWREQWWWQEMAKVRVSKVGDEGICGIFRCIEKK